MYFILLICGVSNSWPYRELNRMEVTRTWDRSSECVEGQMQRPRSKDTSLLGGIHSGELLYCMVNIFNNNVSYFWKMQIGLVISQDIHTLLSVAAKTSPPTAMWGRKGLICLIRLEGPSEQDSRQEAGGRNWSRTHSLLACSLLSLSLLLYTAQDHLPRMALPTVGLHRIHQLAIKKMPQRHAHKPTW